MRCLLLLIPVLGNIVVGLYDFANGVYQDKNSMLVALHTFGSYVFTFASPELQNDKEFDFCSQSKRFKTAVSKQSTSKRTPDVARCSPNKTALRLHLQSDSLKEVRKFVLAAFYTTPAPKMMQVLSFKKS